MIAFNWKLNISLLILLICIINSAFSFNALRTGQNSYKNAFRTCCAIGKESANMSSSCEDYSRLNDKSAGCKYAFSICCNQNKRTSECERGKKHAIAGLPCADLKKDSVCDTLMDCCNCCELGIQTRKSGDDCSPMYELSNECNNIFMDCCKRTAYDECSNPNICPYGQICENTKSGPVCRCPTGFEKDARSNQCIDIDECRRPYACEPGSTCQNTVGSYMCTKSCGSGYTFSAVIIQCLDVNECARGIHNCAMGMRCENYPGSFRCIREKPCGTGYQVNVYTQDCEDIDECSLNLHDCSRGFICLNVPGTFKCKAKECGHGYLFNYNTGECDKIRCLEGYEIDATGKCADIDECQRPGNPVCHFNEKCENTPGSYKCILILICGEGYELNENKTECIDIDECKIGRHTCPSQATCVNIPRSYKCVCPTGYKLDETTNMCDDIDECAFGKVCPPNSYCKNTPGSFNCECKQGFSLVSHIFYSCVDDDECKKPGICDHKCVNTYGSYQCTCSEGYKLAADKRTCVDVDECTLQPNICPGICINTPGSYECACASGFVLDLRQRRICEDVDECEQKTHNCGKEDICVNTRGSFQCLRLECPAGYNLIAEVKNTRCDRGHAICKYGELDCIKKPMKIFYSHTSFSYLVPVPIRVFTTRVNTYSRRIRLEYDFKVTDSKGLHLREDQFLVKQTDANTFDVFLLEPCKAAENLQLELKIEFYNDNQFSSCLLNKIFVYITE